MVGTNPRAEPFFPHAQRYALHVVALLHEQARCDRTVDAAAHGNDNFWLSLNHRTVRMISTYCPCMDVTKDATAPIDKAHSYLREPFLLWTLATRSSLFNSNV